MRAPITLLRTALVAMVAAAVSLTAAGGAFAGPAPSPSAGSTAVAPAPFTKAPTPTMAGTFVIGNTVTAAPGTWSPTPVLTYQWLRDGNPIAGATAATYTLVAPADHGHDISVQVTATATGYATTTRTSAPRGVAGRTFTTTPTPTVTGDITLDQLTVGQTVTGDAGTWVPTPVYRAYQWLRNGDPIPGATGHTYTVTDADDRAGIQLQVTAMLSGYRSTTMVSAMHWAYAPGFNAKPSLQITGDMTVLKTVTATATGAWSPTPTSLTYQWYRSGTAIPGATGRTYTLAPEDNEAWLYVEVTARRSGYHTTIVGSDGMPHVHGLTFTTSPGPTVTGTAAVGGTLTATLGSWQPAPTGRTYQWLRAGLPIAGATSSTYALRESDVGHDVSVQVSSTRLGYSTITQVSAPVRVASGTSRPVQVVAGNGWLEALRADGVALAWGTNWAWGAVDDGFRAVPAPVDGLPPVARLGAGLTTSAALARDGSVWTWGYDWFWHFSSEHPWQEMLTTPWSAPARVSGLPTVTQLAVGQYVDDPNRVWTHPNHLLALAADGTVWAWGANDDGQLGDGTTTSRSTPAKAIGLSGIVQVAAGSGSSYALGADGTVWRLGVHTSRVDGATGIVQIALDQETGSLAMLTKDGTLLGGPGTTPRLTSIAAGSGFTLGLAADGTVWEWTTVIDLGHSRMVGPTRVTGLTGVVSIAVGAEAAAVTADGTVWCWHDRYGSTPTKVPTS